VILEHFSLEERKEEECKLRDFFHFLVDFSRYFLLVTFKSRNIYSLERGGAGWKRISLGINGEPSSLYKVVCVRASTESAQVFANWRDFIFRTCRFEQPKVNELIPGLEIAVCKTQSACFVNPEIHVWETACKQSCVLDVGISEDGVHSAHRFSHQVAGVHIPDACHRRAYRLAGRDHESSENWQFACKFRAADVALMSREILRILRNGSKVAASAQRRRASARNAQGTFRCIPIRISTSRYFASLIWSWRKLWIGESGLRDLHVHSRVFIRDHVNAHPLLTSIVLISGPETLLTDACVLPPSKCATLTSFNVTNSRFSFRATEICLANDAVTPSRIYPYFRWEKPCYDPGA